MLVYGEEVESMVNGYDEKEAIYKRFHWRESNECFYVYQSSVPDPIYPDDESRDDVTRYDLVQHSMCFRRMGESDDLMLEQLY